MVQQTSMLQQIYRGFLFILTFIAAVLMGIALHMGEQYGMSLCVVGFLLACVAALMTAPLRNPAFGCLLFVMAIVVTVIVAAI